MNELSVLVVFTAGLFSFLSPCVLPLIPSYLSFLSGVSLEEMRSGTMQGDIRRQVVLNSLFFILGFQSSSSLWALLLAIWAAFL